MLARLQRGIVGVVVLLALLAAWKLQNHGFAASLIGFMAVAGATAAVLAIEFIVVGWVNRSDPVPAASLRQLVGAWWGETRAAYATFGWRQPFCAHAVPDYMPPAGMPPQRGVVLVHGFFCNRGFWTPWLQALRQRGIPFAAVSLEPVFGSIDDYGPTITHAVRAVRDATGLPPVIVCHSMGGLVVRAWLRQHAAAEKLAVAHVVTLGTPHHGTLLARFGHGKNARQMRRNSDWLQQLARVVNDASPAPVLPFTCWYSNCDNIVAPASTAMLPGADNRHLPGLGHVQLAFAPQPLQHLWELLRASGDLAAAQPAKTPGSDPKVAETTHFS